MQGRHAGGGARAGERIADPGEADARVLDHLARLGSDPSKAREARHFFYVPDRLDAEAVADTLTSDGWQTTMDEGYDAWIVVATRIRRLTPELVRQTRARFETIASQHRAEYDGWEADRF